MSPVPAWVRSLRPDPSRLRQDAVAGVPSAIASVPDGMASAVLVGRESRVRPVREHGRSDPGGVLAVSTRLMGVTTITTAAALAARHVARRPMPPHRGSSADGSARRTGHCEEPPEAHRWRFGLRNAEPKPLLARCKRDVVWAAET